jgi:hypothetical protein
MIKEMVKGEKEKMLERNLYIHNNPSYSTLRHIQISSVADTYIFYCKYILFCLLSIYQIRKETQCDAEIAQLSYSFPPHVVMNQGKFNLIYLSK